HSPAPPSGRAAAEEDARLIAAALAGDRRPFAELYRRHIESVYARLTRIVGPVPERDDLLQQIFLDVHRALPRFRGEASFSTFLHRIVVNVAYEHLERQRRRGGRALPLDGAWVDGLVAPGASPEEQARQRRELADALRHLEALPPKKRIAFVLVTIEGLSLDAAGALVGAEPETVKQRVLSARREIARRIG